MLDSVKVVKAKSAKLQGARTYARARAEENTLINIDSHTIKIYAR